MQEVIELTIYMLPVILSYRFALTAHNAINMYFNNNELSPWILEEYITHHTINRQIYTTIPNAAVDDVIPNNTDFEKHISKQLNREYSCLPREEYVLFEASETNNIIMYTLTSNISKGK